MAFQNSSPFEIIASPFEIWIAPIEEAFPTIQENPTGNWVKVGGSAGPLNFFDDGITVSHGQSLSRWRPLGDNAPRKIFRTEEELTIAGILADLTLEQYSYAINSNPVTTTAPTATDPGFKTLGLSRGIAIATNALLVRGPSPYLADLNMQFELPRVMQVGEPEPVFKRDEPAGLALMWEALVDPAATSADQRFGRLVAAHLAATG